MNIKPPKNKDEKYRKHKYLIWKDEEGFLHLDNYSLEELKKFSDSINKEITKVSVSKKDITITNKTK